MAAQIVGAGFYPSIGGHGCRILGPTLTRKLVEIGLFSERWHVFHGFRVDPKLARFAPAN
jgi:hypothetical protein